MNGSLLGELRRQQTEFGAVPNDEAKDSDLTSQNESDQKRDESDIMLDDPSFKLLARVALPIGRGDESKLDDSTITESMTDDEEILDTEEKLACKIEQFINSKVKSLALYSEEETKSTDVDTSAKQIIVKAMDDIEKAKSDQEWQPTVAKYIQKVESAPYKASEEFTEHVMNDADLPEDTEISLKLFQKMLGNAGIKNPLFFDSRHPSMSSMTDEVNNLAQLVDAKNQGFVLSLHTDEPADKLQVKLTTMQACINEGIPNRDLDDVRKKLAIAHGLDDDWECIKIISVFEGSLCFKYTVDDLTGDAWERVKSTARGGIEELKREFPKFKSAKIHPLLYRPVFDINNFDERGNKEFSGIPKRFSIGPSADLKETYTQPSGWTRYGLRVLGKYDSDTWIHPFSETRMWWKAYHGTRRAESVAGIHPADAIHNIAFVTGFHVSETGKKLGGSKKSRAVHGRGVYCATTPEDAYVATETLVLKGEKKTFQYVMMCAVRPSRNGVKNVSDGKWWVVKDKNDIRPYGILVKELNNVNIRPNEKINKQSNKETSKASSWGILWIFLILGVFCSFFLNWIRS